MIGFGISKHADIIFTVVTDDSVMRTIFDEETKSSLVQHAQGRIFINCVPCCFLSYLSMLSIIPQVKTHVPFSQKSALPEATLTNQRERTTDSHHTLKIHNPETDHVNTGSFRLNSRPHDQHDPLSFRWSHRPS